MFTLVAHFTLFMQYRRIIVYMILAGWITACSKPDTESPLLEPYVDSDTHYRGTPYTAPGFWVADNHTCNMNELVSVTSSVDENRYGTYTTTYSVSDEAGNTSEVTIPVDVILPISDYYDIEWKAYDTCTSGNYNYYGLILDCDCEGDFVTAANFSNFGLSAVFNLPVSGTYYQFLTLDTTKAGVTFTGTATMSPAADTLKWSYIISDSISSDVCTSVWIKQ